MKNEFELQRKYFKKNYLRFMPADKQARILELGCGMGHFYYFANSEGYHNYKGIDTSKEQIEFMKNKFGPDTNVCVDDVFRFLNTPPSGGGYDVVIFNDVIEHLTKPEILDVLDGIYRILNPNGVFMVKTPNMANPFVNTAGRYICITHEVGFTEFSMKEVLRATGFQDIKIIGTDVYVLNPVISLIAKAVSKILNLLLFLLSALYGRVGLRIFEKDILAIAYKRG